MRGTIKLARASVKKTKVSSATVAKASEASPRKASRIVTPPATVAAREANRQVFQTFVAGPHDPSSVATCDPADRAHGVRDDRGFLVPAAIGKRPTRAKPNIVVEHATPRVYHRSHVNNAGLAIDSQFDALYEAQQRLEGIPGIGRDSCSTSAMQLSAAVGRMSPRQFAMLQRGHQQHVPELGE